MMAEGSIESSRWLHGGQVEHEHPTYRAFSETDVDQISKERRVRLRGPNTHTEIKVSSVLIKALKKRAFQNVSHRFLPRYSWCLDT